MKLTDIEKTQLKLLYANGYRYLARDDLGLCAYKYKPMLSISKAKDYPFRSWAPQSVKGEFVLFMDNEEFLKVGFTENEPYMITENATLRLCKLSQKAVAV